METLKLKDLGLRLVSYSENEDYDESKFTNDSKRINEQNVNLEMGIDSDTKEATISVTTTCGYKEGEIFENCFIAKTKQKFLIENFDEVITKNELGHIIVDKEILNHLAAITIAESRGIITSIPKKDGFGKLNIPFFEWRKMFGKGINIEDEKTD